MKANMSHLENPRGFIQAKIPLVMELQGSKSQHRLKGNDSSQI